MRLYTIVYIEKISITFNHQIAIHIIFFLYVYSYKIYWYLYWLPCSIYLIILNTSFWNDFLLLLSLSVYFFKIQFKLNIKACFQIFHLYKNVNLKRIKSKHLSRVNDILFVWDKIWKMIKFCQIFVWIAEKRRSIVYQVT